MDTSIRVGMTVNGGVNFTLSLAPVRSRPDNSKSVTTLHSLACSGHGKLRDKLSPGQWEHGKTPEWMDFLQATSGLEVSQSAEKECHYVLSSRRLKHIKDPALEKCN